MRLTWCVMALVAVLAVGCTGSDDTVDTTTTVPTVGRAATDGGGEDRPSGSWVMVRWMVETSDLNVRRRGEAIETRVVVTPDCERGPCDLTIAPGGDDGSYRAPGAVAPVDGDEPANEMTLAWDAATASYRGESTETFTCRDVDGDVAGDATRSIEVSLAFTPPSADAPARLAGNWQQSVEPTPEALTFGCPGASSSWTVAAAPVGAFDDVEVPIDDTYVSTASVVTADEDGPAVGLRELLGDATIAGDPSDLSITGSLGVPAPLALAPGGWGGAASGPTTCTGYLAEVADGATGTETWSDLHVIAMTDGDTPILSGARSLDVTPTAGGAESGCTPQVTSGRVVLVPTDEIR